MTAEARERSDYHLNDWGPDIRFFPDLIPFVGLLVFFERSRRQSGLSIKEALKSFAKAISSPRQLFSIGTADWPRPTDLGAYGRMQLNEARNMTFASYHTLLPLWMPKLMDSVSPLVNSVAEQLPKLPIG